jgi:putative DNA primase/helicase
MSAESVSLRVVPGGATQTGTDTWTKIVVDALDGDVDAWQTIVDVRDVVDWPRVYPAALRARPRCESRLQELRYGATGDLTHDGLALEFGERSHDARYVAAMGRWYFDRGPRWTEDDTLEHMTRVRAFLRQRADDLGGEHDTKARLLRQADTVAKVLGLARSNTAQAATVDQWDADPWLLGTPGGVVDLRTGELGPTRGDDYITKNTAVAPAPLGTQAPLWLWVLARITAGRTELQDYIQRYFGYCLTGVTRDQVFAFAHGTGANGKSLFITTVGSIMADYAATVPTELLMVAQNERHPTELARLRGVRLAIGSETEEGRRWAEARIKSLTGGDVITARFMRQDFFEFRPQFKLAIIGNHKPSLRGVDEAMRRRLHLIPFTVTIPPEERDPDLPDKLREEWPAILRWMIDGCLQWQRTGLQPPDAVRAATDEYLEAEDALNLWMEECVELVPDAWESSGTLFASWRAWAEKAGEFVGTAKRLTQTLADRGFVPQRQSGTGLRGFRGLRVVDVRPERWAP